MSPPGDKSDGYRCQSYTSGGSYCSIMLEVKQTGLRACVHTHARSRASDLFRPAERRQTPLCERAGKTFVFILDVRMYNPPGTLLQDVFFVSLNQKTPPQIRSASAGSSWPVSVVSEDTAFARSYHLVLNSRRSSTLTASNGIKIS